MARGDVKFFAYFDLIAKSGTPFNLTTDALKLGIVNSTIVPTISTANPRWGAGGTTDFSANQVPLATSYTGPITLTGVSWTSAAGVNTLNAASISIPQDGAGFTTAAYGILYDDTVAGKFAIAFVDLGGPVSIQGGALALNWNVAGVGTDTAI